MHVGLHALGIGAGADRAVVDAVATSAEQHGFATLWAGEHVVMVDKPASTYPYAADGKIAVPAVADWLDPLICLSFAAAATTRIRVATGVLLLPEHQPVLVAKQAASLDRLSGGRLTLGVGVGWLKEEFDALGVPFAGRAGRTREYVDAIRTLWRDDVATFRGKCVEFEAVRVNPKPVRDRRIPIVLGGNSDATMRRVVAWADGWYGFSLDDVNAVAGRVEMIDRLCRDSGRDRNALRLAVALRQPQLDDLAALAQLGIEEFVIVAAPPHTASEVPDWTADLARRWKAP